MSALFVKLHLDDLRRIREQLPARGQESAREAYLTLRQAAAEAGDFEGTEPRALKDLAACSALSERRLRERLVALERIGIARLDRRKDESGRSLPTLYTLVDRGDETSHRGDETSHRGDTRRTFSGRSVTPNARARRESKKENPSLKGFPPEACSDSPPDDAAAAIKQAVGVLLAGDPDLEVYFDALHVHRVEGDTIVCGADPRHIAWINDRIAGGLAREAGHPVRAVACAGPLRLVEGMAS